MLCILYGNGNEISINLSKLNYIRQEFRCTLYIYECKEESKHRNPFTCI